MQHHRWQEYPQRLLGLVPTPETADKSVPAKNAAFGLAKGARRTNLENILRRKAVGIEFIPRFAHLVRLAETVKVGEGIALLLRFWWASNCLTGLISIRKVLAA